MSCGDLCTAAKCAELEGRIDELQQLIFELAGLVQEHRALPVPYAHDIIPDFNVVTQLNEQDLTTKVVLFGQEQESTVSLPDSVIPTVAVEVVQLDPYNHEIQVTVNDILDTATLTTNQSQIEFGIEELNENEYGFGIIFDGQPYGAILDLSDAVANNQNSFGADFDINVSYQFNLLTVAVTADGITRQDTVYIDADVINRFGGVGSGINIGEQDVGCQQVAEELKVDLGEILAAIAAVQAQVTQVKEVVTVEVQAYALSKFDCPEDNGSTGAENNAAQVEQYKLPTLPALHEQLQWMNQNQVAIFEHLCANSGVLAFPDWWQVRLGSDVPQLVCTFRKGNTSTYHSYAIPHPRDTSQPTEALLPAFTKGSWQGMIVCKDNSKFIINCNTKAEAERMCAIAAQLIDNNYLELPPRIYVGERKGQAVGKAPMILATIQYFESGQQNTIPNWRVRVAELEN